MSELTEHLKGYADPQYKKELLGKGSLDNVISDLLQDAALAADRIEALEAALLESAALMKSSAHLERRAGARIEALEAALREIEEGCFSSPDPWLKHVTKLASAALDPASVSATLRPTQSQEDAGK